ncbi:hypothetical protein CYLTODRAFT_392887 [Cylindrobasidium torrendii FP15055 ss-10]|uniref:MYND-type domain-containing protein n=1 Tax=Cylindrobasidium torrendii FP15055 ss-10 TaxID=1314674 RepID=A0A0D7BHJ8_9AGAR|nr:hypothetical protein CYLTODRAFT_392887 [Cylindrobasidium torrendii FP15055 ss-10]
MVLVNRDIFCAVCSSNSATLQQCSGCKSRLYCGQECQRNDWPTHKNECTKGKQWYDRYRLCRDGSKHQGKLELMTWGESAEDNDGDETGWGCCLIDECEGLKKLYETKYGSDDSRFYKYWPQGFRWTCCGTTGDMSYGCDHHGTGSRPCTCDFCRMGKPLPDRIYDMNKAPRRGLTLSRGPDPRSYNSAQAAIAEIGRAMTGIDNL